MMAFYSHIVHVLFDILGPCNQKAPPMNPMPFSDLGSDAKFAPEAALIDQLVAQAALSPDARARISDRAADLVRRIRKEARPSLMENFLAEYGLSTREGVALMCLAEAMLRVPDRATIDELIEDKIAPSDWGRHLGEASSPMVNASTWALMLTGKVLEDARPGLAGTLRGAIRRLGEPVIRTAVTRAMREMGRQFVLGQTIDAALDRARVREAQGFTYSYDMLGEAAMTAADATRYAEDYARAIAAIARACTNGSVETNPGISIKLSALHPRYEVAQQDRVLRELVPVVTRLARQARAAGMGLNIDAEEQDRLVLSMAVIEAVLSDPELAGWDGFGVVVQAYGKRAGAMIDWLHALASRLNRRIMVRLVKGAYWDTEMKRAQVEGSADFPLFTSKVATDVSYVAHARKLIGYADRIYPQFATHNAHSVAAILELAEGVPFEFQRLHGMGERLHDIVLRETGGAAAFMRRWGRIATCWPIWCAGCWKTARIRHSCIRSWMRPSRPKPSPPIPSPPWRPPQPPPDWPHQPRSLARGGSIRAVSICPTPRRWPGSKRP